MSCHFPKGWRPFAGLGVAGSRTLSVRTAFILRLTPALRSPNRIEVFTLIKITRLFDMAHGTSFKARVPRLKVARRRRGHRTRLRLAAS